MLFLRKKTFEATVQQAVQDALADRESSHAADLSALKDEMETLRADIAARETELHGSLELRLLAERDRQNVGVKELLRAVQAIEPGVTPEALEASATSLRRYTEALVAPLREVEDTVSYLLASPPTVVTVTRQLPAALAAAAEPGPVRPMGVR